MEIADALLVTAGLLDLALGIIILLRNRKSQVYLSFAFFSFSLAGWVLGVVLFRVTADLTWALWWAKGYYIAASFIAASLLYFAHVFPEGKPISSVRTLLILGPSVFHAVLLAIPGYLTKQITVHPWGKEVVLGGVEYLIYTVYFLPFFYGALYILWLKYRQYTGRLKRQIEFVLVSVLVASIFGVTFNLILPWFGNYRLIHVGPPFTLIIFWYLSYAIVRHQWLDIRLVAARTVAYSLLVIVIAVFYVGATFVVSALFFNLPSSPNQLVIYTVLTIVVALSFERLKKFLERATDRIFFRASYDNNQLLYSLGSIMSTTIELEILGRKLLQVLLSQMHITRASLLLFDRDSIYEVISEGVTEAPLYQYSQVVPLVGYDTIQVFDELQECTLKDVLRNLSVAVAIPLQVKNEAVGLLLLSEKASGDMYSEQDIAVLGILRPEIAVAIRNAQSYDQIKKFNITLSDEVKKATEDLQYANARLQELDKLKDDFVGIASHELRSPMAAIKSYLWMALHRGKQQINPDMQRYLNNGLIATNRLINLVNDMLNVSRIEGGRISLHLTSVDIVDLTKRTIQELSPRFVEREVESIVQEQSVPRVLCDMDKIQEVLLNLVGNALKFTPTGGRVSVYFGYAEPYVWVSVQDTGIGMSKEDIGRLFVKFGRLNNSYVTTGDATGSGLGLYISRSLVGLHKGAITAESAGPNLGSRFTFTLPVVGSEIARELAATTPRDVGGAKELERVAVA